MERTLVILLVLAAAGCISQAGPETECRETGCPVDLPPETAHRCGDRNLTAPEECDAGFPCPKGTVCQKCRCVTPAPDEAIDAGECAGACSGYGYGNHSVTDDGGCGYDFGAERQCAVRCAYRKVIPLTDSGKVCCCRELKYINCAFDVLKKKCDCPADGETAGICRENRPGANATTEGST